MAALSTQQRQRILQRFAERLSTRRDAFDLRRADLVAAVAATDDWIDANAASFNAALPQAARTALTASQKVELFSLVAELRYSG
jgi:hypothetical protein